MADEQETTEMVTEQPKAEIAEGQVEEPKKLSLSELQAELEQTRNALKKANNEAAKRRKMVEAYETKEKERQDAELSEMERLQKQLEEAQSKLQTQELNALKQAVAKKVGLPDALALRLQGDDEESLTLDAKALLETLPKAQKAPTLMATNPGGNAEPQKETKTQRMARLHRTGNNPFDPAIAAKIGGGVIVQDGNQ